MPEYSPRHRGGRSEALWRRRPRRLGAAATALALIAVGCGSGGAAETSDAAPSTTTRERSTTTDHDMDAMVAGDEHDHEGGGSVDDGGLSLLENGQMHHEAPADVAVDADTQRALDLQLDTTRALAEVYPTVADAEAAGWRRVGPFSPGLGTHYTPPTSSFNGDGIMDDADLAAPTLIYDGSEPSSPIAGFMYLSYREDEPEGFAGPNDHWHFHTSVCVVARDGGGVDTPLGADRDVSEDQCSAVGGALVPFTGYMVHVWTVPGYESPRGTFSDLNPALSCADGTYYTIDIEELGSGDTMCTA